MKKALLFIFAITFSLASFAQGGDKFPANRQDELMFEEAEILLSEDNFEKALEIYLKLLAKYPDESAINYRVGMCKQQEPQGDEDALKYFQKVDHKEFGGTDYSYYYGLSLHKNYKFEEAIAELELFIKKAKPSKQLKAEANKIIQNCKNGIELVKNPAAVSIVTIGDPLNTMHNEYAPIISADERSIMFTYRGELSEGGLQEIEGTNKKDYNEDIMWAVKDTSGEWYEPLHLANNINTEGNDACVGLTPDAQYMYMFRSLGADPGSLYKSELDGMTWSDPELMKGDINSPAWEGSITISHDSRIVYFASERPGGKGGRDIYQARYRADGSWGDVKNIGDKVNTSLNDDAPFLHPSGKYLVFSSEGHNSMGGYDIFVSELQDDSTWGAPRNIGYPINSPYDDKFYTVSSDGKHGYYSSGKKSGMGKQDIYKVSPGIDKQVVLAQVTGHVFLDDFPSFAEIEVMDDSPVALKTVYNSNSISGKFLIALPPGHLYTLTFKIGGMESKTYQVDTRNITGFVEKYLLVKFYTNGENNEIIETTKPTRDTLLTKVTPKDTVKTNPVNNIEVTPKDTSKTMPVSQLLDFSHPELTYRVQVGAYRYPQNFRVEKYERDEKSKKEQLNDGITRFTIKQFKTLKEAYAYKDEMIKLGVSDAFVTAIYKGKRYLLVDLRPVLLKTLPFETK